MLRLRLLGSRELERADQTDASAVFAQPKRFALLAYMACRADRFHRRDTLLAVFWPELDTFAARRALRNALYHLRLALGEDVFIARGDDELMIDRANEAAAKFRDAGAILVSANTKDMARIARIVPFDFVARYHELR